ncbi:MAG: methyltransferase domain-containing protein [Rhizobiaceae bacterium]
MDLSTKHEQRLKRAQAIFREGDDFLLDLAVDDMIERLGAVSRTHEKAAALFGRTSRLAEELAKLESIQGVIRVEENIHLGNADTVATPDTQNLAEDSFDLIAAPLALHWAQDIPGALIQISRALRPDGLLLASLPGPETLNELRAVLLQAESEIIGGAAMRVDRLTDIRDAGALLQRCGFALPVVDQDTVTVRYDTLFDLVADLRRFGATSGKSSPNLSRATVLRAAELYAKQFSDPDGRIRASFQFVSMSGWKPHESQQKPLRPGSAETRLADALKTDERPLKP